MKEVLSLMGENPEITIAAMTAFGLAFSKKTRKIIGDRDGWKCREPGCDKSYQEGDVVHVAHFNHDRSESDYDEPQSGVILCVDHHQKLHESFIGQAFKIGLCEEGNGHAINMLKGTKRKNKTRRK